MAKGTRTDSFRRPLTGNVETGGSSPRPPLSITDTAVALGVSRNVIYRLIDEGELRVIKIGDMPKIRQGEIDAYLDRLTVAASQGPPTRTRSA